MTKKGYASGVFDMFHVGHLNILRSAKERCDFLTVGVTTDELCEIVKNKRPIIPFEERVEILRSIKFVDQVIPQTSMNKNENFILLGGYDIMFVGDDHKGTKKWNLIEEAMGDLGVQVIYLPYTKHISSTILREKIGR